jgi:hypothetical protein
MEQRNKPTTDKQSIMVIAIITICFAACLILPDLLASSLSGEAQRIEELNNTIQPTPTLTQEEKDSFVISSNGSASVPIGTNDNIPLTVENRYDGIHVSDATIKGTHTIRVPYACVHPYILSDSTVKIVHRNDAGDIDATWRQKVRNDKGYVYFSDLPFSEIIIGDEHDKRLNELNGKTIKNTKNIDKSKFNDKSKSTDISTDDDTILNMTISSDGLHITDIEDKSHGNSKDDKNKTKIYNMRISYNHITPYIINGKIKLTHHNDVGVTDATWLQEIENENGYVYFERIPFSEIVIGGYTGTYTVSATNVTGDTSISLGGEFKTANISSITLNITNPYIDVTNESFSSGSSNWLEGWNYRKTITVDHTKVAGNLTYFPMLVNISGDTDLGTNALANGYDLRFVNTTGALLDYERENFTTSDGSTNALIWIELPSVSSVVDTVTYMYYGNSSAIDGQNITGTWDENGANRYSGVYHLSELGTGISGVYKDSTNNPVNSTNTAGQPLQTDAKIGKGQNFNNASSQRINLGNNYNVGTSSFTLSSWIKPQDTNQKTAILTKRTEGAPYTQYQLHTGYVNSAGDNVASKCVGFFAYSGGQMQSYHTPNFIEVKAGYDKTLQRYPSR